MFFTLYPIQSNCLNYIDSSICIIRFTFRLTLLTISPPIFGSEVFLVKDFDKEVYMNTETCTVKEGDKEDLINSDA